MINKIEKPLLSSGNSLQFLGRRLKEAFQREQLGPRKYVIKGKPISWSDLDEGLREDRLLHGQRITGKIPSSITGYHLEVASHSNLLLHKERYVPLVSMVILGDLKNKTSQLYSLECWAEVGLKKYRLVYSTTDQKDISILSNVIPLSHYTGNLYVEGKPLSAEKIKKLNLAEKGFPETVDWVNTAKMYAFQVKPNKNGEVYIFNEPLTAGDIRKQTLLPAK